MTSRFRNFKIRDKDTSQIVVKLFVENFIKIDPSVWAVSLSHTHKHTYIHTHTHIHTHTLSSIATYSVKMTEYKKQTHTQIRTAYAEVASSFNENCNLYQYFGG